MNQPNFHTNDAAVAGTDYDNLPPDELDKLINEAHRLKTGRAGRIAPAPPPPAKGYVDLDALMKGLA
jgi:hypothetical protein